MKQLSAAAVERAMKLQDVGDEEPLDLMQQVAVQIAQKTNVRVIARICGDSD